MPMLMQYRPPRSARKLTAYKTEKGEISTVCTKNWIFKQTVFLLRFHIGWIYDQNILIEINGFLINVSETNLMAQLVKPNLTIAK